MILLIVNNNPYHYEIIESVINQYDKILSINKTQISKILLKIIPDESFIAYIKMKYPAIIINGNSYFNMKYLINVSIYHSNYDLIRKMKNSYYITHETHDDFKQHDNVLSTTPLCGTNKYMYFTDLPFSEKKQNGWSATHRPDWGCTNPPHDSSFCKSNRDFINRPLVSTDTTVGGLGFKSR